MPISYKNFSISYMFLAALVFLFLISVTFVGVLLADQATGSPSPTDTTDLKLLLVCANTDEPSCRAGAENLDRLGTPYGIMNAVSQSLTGEMLSDGASHAYYSGVILSTGNLAYYDSSSASWQSAFTSSEWQILHDFEARFSLREASLYTFPSWEYGLQYMGSVDTTSTPLSASLTPAGAEVFGYLNDAATLVFRYAWGYLSRPLFMATPAGSETTPLLVTEDGYTVAAIHHYEDGRVSLVLCIDNNPNLIHSQALMYGVIQWVSRGVFLGERHIYLSPQVDDLFLGNDIWDPVSNTNLPSEHRISGNDLEFLTSWQQHVQSTRPTASSFRMNLVFNGEGTTAYGASDSLTNTARNLQSNFFWTNHTFSHPYLDDAGYAESLAEIQNNNAVADSMGFSLYNPTGLVTGNMTGLGNPDFLTAARDAGVLYLASNTSIPEQNNPGPNTGIVSPIVPAILLVPRHPANIFYNVSTPEQEVSEYNFIYRGFWGRDLTYQEIIDVESDNLLRYMITYDIDPIMFHQSNIGVYNSSTYGTGTLLSDLMDATIDKYEAIFSLPIISLSHASIGQKMKARSSFNESGARGAMGGGIINVTAESATTIPVTGLAGINDERYGGESISYVLVDGGSTVSASVAGPPVITNAQPLPAASINDGRPHIGVDYTDPVWDIDPSGVRVYVDGADVTASSLITGAFVSYTPSTFTDGVHNVKVTVMGRSGQTAEKSWQFSNTSPLPSLSNQRTFWANYEDYVARELSVTYRLLNKGSGTARQPAVEGGIATSGVIMISETPIYYADLVPSSEVSLTLKYKIPSGVNRFRSTTYVTVRDDSGNVFGLPSP